MRVALIGYGKMGKEIEVLALAKGHEIVLKVDVHNAASVTAKDIAAADAAIEFSTPETAANNILKCFDANVPVVVGTTGWMNRLDEIRKLCTEKKQALFYASNFSVGVNIFFEINRRLAQIMDAQPSYDVVMEEIHHTQKLDAPSGTAITLASDILERIKRKTKWVNTVGEKTSIAQRNVKSEDLLISSFRIENVPGTHTVEWNSTVDSLEIKHTAHSRKGFAAGALMAAEWIVGKKGIFGMQNMLSFT